MPELSVTLMLGKDWTDVQRRSFCKHQLNRREQIARSLLPHSTADKRVEAQASDPFEAFLLDRQQFLIKETQRLDGHDKAKFRQHKWQRDPKNPGAGYGITAVLEGGDLLEKAAVNISIIAGELSKERAAAMSSRGRPGIDPSGGQQYSAAALSLVYHPAHPFVPILRADVRRFKVGSECWYGGGADLTPMYFDKQDAIQFHRFWKPVCDKHGPNLYPRYKKWCDEYFYIPARREHRGIGGIFFDDLVGGNADEPANAEQFVRSIAEGFLASWEQIACRHRHKGFEQRHRDWQLIRRGRYVEFNLLYDRGVRFGLGGGRIESIMVSAPPLVAWKYDEGLEMESTQETDAENAQDTDAEKLMLHVLQTDPVDWVDC